MDDYGDNSWDALKARVTMEKGRLERKAVEIGQLEAELRSCNQTTLESKVASVAAMKDDIDRGLKDYSAILAGLGQAAVSAPQRAQLNMYRATYLELERDLQRGKRKLDDHFVRNRLFGVKSEGSAPVDDEEAGLIRERGHLEQTIGMTDEVIASARANYDALSHQASRFKVLSDKANQLSGMLPDVDTLIGKVGSEKRKESMVLGATFGICIVFILWWEFLA